MGLYTLVAVAGIGVCYKLFATDSNLTTAWMKNPVVRFIHNVLWRKYYVDEIYNSVFVDGLLGTSRWVWRLFDEGVVDGLVNLAGGTANFAGLTLRLLQTGNVRFYLAAFTTGVILLLALALKLV